MPIRVVVLLNLGPLFGGFRFATRPGMFGLDAPRAFAVLERSVESAFTLLSAHDPADWAALAPTGFDAALPRLEENIGAAALELTSADLRDIDRAASTIAVEGARYPDRLEQLTGR
jgi:hypothetical protein